MVAVVALYAVCFTVSATVVKSLAQQLQPFGAVEPGVIVTVQVPAVPLWKEPANCPPFAELREQPETV